jgi:hypothetical protein
MEHNADKFRRLSRAEQVHLILLDGDAALIKSSTRRNRRL